ncbi:hypothetical protein SGPA1_11269 [Streptomyces misionensis JCM 4497]
MSHTNCSALKSGERAGGAAGSGEAPVSAMRQTVGRKAALASGPGRAPLSGAGYWIHAVDGLLAADGGALRSRVRRHVRARPRDDGAGRAHGERGPGRRLGGQGRVAGGVHRHGRAGGAALRERHRGRPVWGEMPRKPVARSTPRHRTVTKTAGGRRLSAAWARLGGWHALTRTSSSRPGPRSRPLRRGPTAHRPRGPARRRAACRAGCRAPWCSRSR